MDESDNWLDSLDWTSVEPMTGTFTHGMEDLLLPNEGIIAEGRGVVLVNLDIAGMLLVTNFRLVFVSEGQRNIVSLGTIPLATIEKFTKQLQPMRAPHVSRVRDKTGSRRLLQVVGKDMRIILFGFRPRTRQRRAVYDGLVRVMKSARLWDLYAFSNDSSTFRNTDPRVRLHAEYLRLLDFKSSLSRHGCYTNQETKRRDSSQSWRITEVNSNFALCPTYPSLLITSSSIRDEEVQQAAAFRARGRLPVMSWRHPVNGAVLARSSQPLIGLMLSNRSNSDEKLVEALCVPPTSLQGRRKLYIADARPRKNAIANGAMGGGSESSANYFQSEVVFLGIENIHAMRESLLRLRDYLDMFGAAPSDGTASFLKAGGLAWGGGNLSSTSAAVSALGDSGWLMHVHNVLAGAAWIAARIALEEASVLVHCSDGWDRTTQLVALSELMLDPYYRTFRGFQALIEKDWLAFGHPFADRLGMPTYSSTSLLATDGLRPSTGSMNVSSPGRINPSSSFSSPVASHSPGAAYNYSPIFLQWVDCVAQLLRLYPRDFEFSPAFLVDLLDCVMSCRFGNFLCNSEKERVQAGVADACGCMWVYLEKQRSAIGKEHEHFNMFYDREQRDGALLPPPAALAPTLWPNYFLRWACPSETGAGGKRANSWVQGGELENECRTMAASFSRIKKAKEKAEAKVKELAARLKSTNEQLHIEKQASVTAAASSIRVRKENSAIKRALQAMGCEVHFSDQDTVPDVSSSDEDVSRRPNLVGRKKKDSASARDAWSIPKVEELAVSVSVTPETDLSANLFRTCGDACNLETEEICNWPTNGCARMNSAFVGLRANFDALEHLSILDCYFNPEEDNQQETRQHPP